MTFILSNHIGLPKALEDYSNKGLQIGLAGLLINGIIFALELISGLSANNAALLTDAFHNLTDSVFGAVTVLSFWIMNRPGTARYPFGFGRVEYLGSFFLGMLMIGTGAHFAAVSLVRAHEIAACMEQHAQQESIYLTVHVDPVR